MALLSTFRSSAGGGSDSTAVAVRSFGAADESDDEFRLIKWHFLAHMSSIEQAGRNPRVILITSARAGEGKSYVAHHLAANFALDPHTELTLIDANFDHPALGTSSWMGGSSGGPGLLDYLESADSDPSGILKSTGLSNVRVILSGHARGNAPELLGSAKLEQLMNALTGRGSFVIIDAGPVLSGGGAAVLARYAGQIAYVVAANSTSRSDINTGLATLDRIAGPIDEKSIGLIFN